MKRTYTLVLYAKDCDTEFKEGMGEGVLATQQVVFDLTKEQYESFQFAYKLEDLGDDLIKETIGVRVEKIETEEDEDKI